MSLELIGLGTGRIRVTTLGAGPHSRSAKLSPEQTTLGSEPVCNDGMYTVDVLSMVFRRQAFSGEFGGRLWA